MKYHTHKNLRYTDFPLVWIIIAKHSKASKRQQASVVDMLVDIHHLASLHLNPLGKVNEMALRQVEFISVRLDEAQKVEYTDWAEKEQFALGELLAGLATSGYKLTVSYSDKTGNFICAVTGRSDPHVNFMKCVTSYHSDVLACILVALYKHNMVLGDTDWSEFASGAEWG